MDKTGEVKEDREDKIDSELQPKSDFQKHAQWRDDNQQNDTDDFHG
jgi:hypothetical protein